MFNKLYHDYNRTTCPVCGGKIKHPYTGSVSVEQLEEDSNCCLWGEVIDESGNTVGYQPICRYVYETNFVLKDEKCNEILKE